MVDFYTVFDDWEHQVVPGFISKWIDRPFPNRPNVTESGYGRELHRVGRKHNWFKRMNCADEGLAWPIPNKHSYPSSGCMGHCR